MTGRTTLLASLLPTLLFGISASVQVVLPMQVFGCTNHDSNSLSNDPAVRQALQEAFEASQEGTPDQHEEGGWIYDCKGPDGWSIKIVKWPPGDYDSIDQGPMLDDPDCQLVGSFHTHAGAPSGHPENDGYKNELPSDADEELAEELGVPGFVKYGLGDDPSTQGTFAYGPMEPGTPCPGEDAFDAAWSAGEPHLQTFDGYDFDFQAAGEFVLVRSASGDLEVQARQEPTGSGHVTMNTAVAVRIGGSVVEVNDSDVVVDGKPTPKSEFRSHDPPGGGAVRDANGTIRFLWPDGSEMSFVGRSVVVGLAPALGGEVGGLLGDFDGDLRNDLLGAGGEPLLNDGRLTYDEVYVDLAEAWLVDDDASLFTYPDGVTTATYRDESVPGFRLTAGALDPGRVEDAEAQCRTQGVEDPTRLAHCIFDVAATGDATFAAEAAAFEEERLRIAAPSEEPALISAVAAVRVEEVVRLLGDGADPDTRGADGRTALLVAVPTGRADLVSALLDGGADPDLADADGTTALHTAAFWGFDDIVGPLLDAGADPSMQDDRGDTPADRARAQGHDDLATLLDAAR